MQHLIYFITQYIGISFRWRVEVSSYLIYFPDTHIKQQLWAFCSNISAQVVFGGAQRLGFHHTHLNIVCCHCSCLAGPLLRSPDLIRPQHCYFKLPPLLWVQTGAKLLEKHALFLIIMIPFDWKPGIKKSSRTKTFDALTVQRRKHNDSYSSTFSISSLIQNKLQEFACN